MFLRNIGSHLPDYTVSYRTQPQCETLGTPRKRWKDIIKMELKELGCDDRMWVELAEDCVALWEVVLETLNSYVSLPES
jgi:hypothetical protein